jgi:hypothetical protein
MQTPNHDIGTLIKAKFMPFFSVQFKLIEYCGIIAFQRFLNNISRISIAK